MREFFGIADCGPDAVDRVCIGAFEPNSRPAIVFDVSSEVHHASVVSSRCRPSASRRSFQRLRRRCFRSLDIFVVTSGTRPRRAC